MSQNEKQLELLVLASGSKGNATVVRNHESGRALLIDCGICKRDFFGRCAELGVDPASIEDVLITHEHTDHTKGLGVVIRGMAKLGLHPRIYASELTRQASRDLCALEGAVEFGTLIAGGALSLAGMQVFPFATSHDAIDPLGCRFEVNGDALGYMTDTGVVTGAAHEALADVRVLAIEGNHDERMLAEGPYPWPLKQRIAGAGGHLSNAQCAGEVQSLLHNGLEQIAVMHISENNNTYGIPVRELEAMLAAEGHGAHVQAALQHGAIKLG